MTEYLSTFPTYKSQMMIIFKQQQAINKGLLANNATSYRSLSKYQSLCTLYALPRLISKAIYETAQKLSIFIICMLLMRKTWFGEVK